jgi:hypothetical protein
MYGVVDEERKINLNKANLQTLKRLFSNLGFEQLQAQELAASIIDFRDEDSRLSIPLGSAEDSYYRWLPEPYQAKNANFEAMRELLLVKGVTPEIFDKLKDFVTIYGTGVVNINTAPHPVLACLGLSKALISKIMTFRYGLDETQGTNDDGVFSGTEVAAAQLNQTTQLLDSELTELANLAASGSVVTASNIFTVHSSAGADNDINEPQLDVVCVVTRQGEILSYVEF